MKRLTAYVTYRLVTILVLCSGIIRGDCPSGMIRVGHLCYKWYASAVSINEAIGTCGKKGGHLAGFENGNFLEIIQENPFLEEYLPKEKCFWVVLPSPSLRLSRLSWLKSVLPGFLMEGISIFFDVFTDSKMCYNKTKWVEEVVYAKTRVDFICEHVVRMKNEFTFIADQPLFEEGAPVPTMCSRLCQEFTGCSMFNYNKLTKQCRGFEEMEKCYIQYHQNWEVWVFE